MIISTEGIVLKGFNYRETSKIITFFSKTEGKVSGILKGIRKDHKKFGSHVDKFTVNDFVYYKYRKTDLHLVSQADLKQYFYPIRQDYKRNIAANYALELVDVIMQPELSNTKVYKLLLNYLSALEDIRDIDKLVHIFQIKMLLHSGFSPHLDSCVKCSKQVKGKARFSMASGGLVCPKCPTTENSFSVISSGAVATILHIERANWATCLRLGLTGSVKKELKYTLNNFLVYHLEKKIKTSRLLH